MKIIENTKLIKRNRSISKIVLYITIIILIVSVYLSLTDENFQQGPGAYAILIIAFFLVQFTVVFGNRWGRTPRMDEIINSALKGLDDRFTLYHYMGKVRHLLVGPAGIWAFNTYHQRGTITYDLKKNKYSQKGGGNPIIKTFTGDSIADVIHYSKLARGDVKKMFTKYAIENYPQPIIANVFYDPGAVIKTQGGPEITIHAKNLKDQVRQAAKKNPLPEKLITEITEKLPKKN